MKNTDEELRSRLTHAILEATHAKDVLSSALRLLGVGAPRASKVAVTADITEAFARLSRAKDELEHVQALLAPALTAEA